MERNIGKRKNVVQVANERQKSALPSTLSYDVKAADKCQKKRQRLPFPYQPCLTPKTNGKPQHKSASQGAISAKLTKMSIGRPHSHLLQDLHPDWTPAEASGASVRLSFLTVAT